MANLEEQFEEIKLTEEERAAEREHDKARIAALEAELALLRGVPAAPEARDAGSAEDDELIRNIKWLLEAGGDHEEGVRRVAEMTRRMAYFDSLTGVRNREGFLITAQPLLDHIGRRPHETIRRPDDNSNFGVIFLDVDNFKQLNDTYGHAAGDAALKHVADILNMTLRDDDIIGRYGGEEFVVAVKCSSKRSDAVRGNPWVLARKIREALHRIPFEYEGKEIPVTASFGVTEAHEGEDDLPAIIKRADEAMYAAKKGGKDRIVVAPD